MNKVVLIGRVVVDPEVRYSQGANPTAIAKYRLAVDRKYKKEGEADADFISCIAFGKNGEFAEKYLKKGTKICVVGRIQTGSYEKDGVKHYTTDIVAEEHEFVESKMSGSTQNNPQTPTQQASGYMGFTQIAADIEEELPFM